MYAFVTLLWQFEIIKCEPVYLGILLFTSLLKMVPEQACTESSPNKNWKTQIFCSKTLG